MTARKKAREKIAGEILVPLISAPPSDCPIAMACGLRLHHFNVPTSTFLNAWIMRNPSPGWRKYRGDERCTWDTGAFVAWEHGTSMARICCGQSCLHGVNQSFT